MLRKISIVTTSLIIGLCMPCTSYAQDDAPALQPLAETVVARFDQMLADIELLKEDVAILDERADEFEDPIRRVLVTRSDKVWTKLFDRTMQFASAIAEQKDAGKDVSNYWGTVERELKQLPKDVYDTLERLRSRVVFPTPDLSPKEFVVADQKLFIQMREVDSIFRALTAYTAVADKFGIDATESREILIADISDSAANRSMFLEIAINDVEMLKSTIATLPENTELRDWSNAAQTRVRMSAAAMSEIIKSLNALGLETRQYRQQVLKVTGEITTAVLDVGIVANLLSEWGNTGFALISEQGPRFMFQLLLAMFILFAFVQLAKLIQKGVDKGLHSGRVNMSHLLRRMIVSIIRNVIVFAGLLIAISQLGISLAPLLAGLGIIGFIIGFALQDSLSNFASGIMILFYRPFDVGDVVDAGGVSGRVSHMSLVNTTFNTLDNQKLIVPNNIIWQSIITNVTAQRTRRIDLVFGISYGDDLEKAERVLREVVAADENVLDDPEPVIRVHELGESSVNFVVRPWVKTNVYWETYGAITKAVKLAFDKEGISIPFPQRDVHVIEQK